MNKKDITFQVFTDKPFPMNTLNSHKKGTNDINAKYFCGSDKFLAIQESDNFFRKDNDG